MRQKKKQRSIVFWKSRTGDKPDGVLLAAILLKWRKIKEPLEAGKWYKTSLGKYDVVLDDNKNQGEDKPDNNKADNKADNSEEQDPSNEWNRMKIRMKKYKIHRMNF